jgi:hypothetical protein
MRFAKGMGVFCSLLAVFALSSCGGGSSAPSNTGGGQPMGGVFTIGTDDPATVPSVVSVMVQITSVQLTDGTTTVNLLNGPQTVDFAKLDGLHGLLDLENVPAGTYNSAIIGVGSVTIQFIDTTVSPPVISTINATATPNSVTQALKNPLVLNDQDLVGFFMDLDLGQSLQTDANGNVTTTFVPTFDVKGLSVDDADAFIDELPGGVTSVNPAGNQFMMQGPLGRMYTVDITNSTDFDSDSLGSFTTNTIVEVSGVLNRVTRDITASEVEVISQDHFATEGLDTFVTETNGCVSQINLYTRAELPALQQFPLQQINPFAFNGNEKYMIANLRLPLTSLLFGPTTQLAGQRIILGGKLDTSVTPPALDVRRVILERQAQRGTVVPNSLQIQSGTNGQFSLNDVSLASTVLPRPLNVISTSFTNFINLNGLSDLSGSPTFKIRIVGFILVNPSDNNAPVLVARSIEKLQ